MPETVVITGIGVVTSNAIGVPDYLEALKQGKSGIQHWEELDKLNLRSQIGGQPSLHEINLSDHLPRLLPESGRPFAKRSHADRETRIRASSTPRAEPAALTQSTSPL